MVTADSKLLVSIISISSSLYIPKGYEVIVTPGQKILLNNNAFVFSNSNWIVGGSKKKTFIGGSSKNYGGGLIIYDNNKESRFINCEFKYLNGLKFKVSQDLAPNDFFNERLIYGSINFFQTNVSIKDSLFENINSEDGLNIISSTYNVTDSFFIKTKHEDIKAITYKDAGVEEYTINEEEYNLKDSKSIETIKLMELAGWVKP